MPYDDVCDGVSHACDALQACLFQPITSQYANSGLHFGYKVSKSVVKNTNRSGGEKIEGLNQTLIK